MKRPLAWALALTAGISAAAAQTYPAKPIRFIVPYPPGGGTDLLARALGQKLSESLGQQVVVENRSGAQGNIGTAAAAKSGADGYTIALSHVGTFAINPLLYKDVGYDPLKDFAHISLATVQPYLIVVNPRVPASNLKQLAALAKVRPGQLSFASSSTVAQMAGELFKLVTSTKMEHIPYKGAGPAVIDLIGGNVDLMFSTPPATVPHVKSTRLRAVAVTSAERLAALPDVPTTKESGYPDLEIVGWYGVAAPANTPKDAVARLNAEIVRALKASDIRERLATDGLEARTNSPEEMASFARKEFERWAKVVTAAGIKPE